MAPKNIEQRLGELETSQATTLLKLTRILIKILDIWGNFLKKRNKKYPRGDVKNQEY